MKLIDKFIPSQGTVYGGELGRSFRSGFHPSLFRPWIDKKGVPRILVNSGDHTVERGERLPIRRSMPVVEYVQRTGNMMVAMNAASLRKEDWIAMDTRMVQVSRERLIAWNDLVASGNTLSDFDAYAHATIEYEAMSDPGEAVVDMFADTPGRTDEIRTILRSTPLPITHSDFWYQDRRIAISKGWIDTAHGEAAARRVSESVERTLIGVDEGIEFGTQTTGYGTHDGLSKNYGYTTFPDTIAKTDLTTPDGTNPEAVMTDVLEMIELLETNGYYGPYLLYHSTAYSRYLSDDYFRTGSTSAVRTLRERLMSIDRISRIQRLDYLTSGYKLIMVDVGTSNPTAPRAVPGMPITTIQWPSMGGTRLNFKVMAIMVAQFRSEYDGICGIVYARQ